ncbi:MAG: sensor histidine kinase [Sulfurimonas sp.]
MRRAERESFFKSFGVFFLSLSLLSAILAYLFYLKLTHEFQEKVYTEMQLCSYTLKCEEYLFDFVELEPIKLYHLMEEQGELFAYFSIPKNEKYALKFSLEREKYQKFLQDMKVTVLKQYLLALVALLVLSLLFSLYALRPLRNALHLTEEFSRDILHDLGTPLAVLRLNVSLLHVMNGDEKKIKRISQGIDTIASLGDNLRSYLEGHAYQKEEIDLLKLLKERILLFEKLYPNIVFSLEGTTFLLEANNDAMVRIVDNILSNAAKYNKIDGFVKVQSDAKSKTLKIQDSGKGIKNPKMVFERFYKEQDRGMGIGLHIVKKFCDALKITIKLESEILKGSVFTLDLKNIIRKQNA